MCYQDYRGPVVFVNNTVIILNTLHNPKAKIIHTIKIKLASVREINSRNVGKVIEGKERLPLDALKRAARHVHDSSRGASDHSHQAFTDAFKETSGTLLLGSCTKEFTSNYLQN